MDTTKKYIEMCEEAEEIQGLCPFKEGDYIFNKSANSDKGFLFVNYRYQPYIDKSHWEELYKPEEYKKSNIWLPRQDQLQEMIPVGCNCGMIWLHQSVKLERFMNWLCNVEEDEAMEASCQHKPYHTTLTWEQLWLAFVMKEKYNKVWNGKEWKTLD